MSAEWIAVIVAIVAVGVTVTVAVVSGFRRLDDRLRAVETRVSDGETNIDAKLRAVETNIDTKLRAVETNIDDRLRAVETELAYLRGLLQGSGVGPVRPPEPPAADEGAAA